MLGSWVSENYKPHDLLQITLLGFLTEASAWTGSVNLLFGLDFLTEAGAWTASVNLLFGLDIYGKAIKRTKTKGTGDSKFRIWLKAQRKAQDGTESTFYHG